MSFFKRHKTLSILGWFLALLIFNVAFHWRKNAANNGLYIFLEAIGYLTTPVEIVASAAAVYGIVSKHRPKSNYAETAPIRRSPRQVGSVIYIAFGMVAVIIAFASSHQKQARNAYTWILKSYSSPIGKSTPLLATELFQKVSPSVFVVETLDGNGNTAALGSGVALARDFLVTNCHVVQSGSSLKISRGKEKWAARLIQAVPGHDLCGLRPKADRQITTAFDEQGRVIFTNEDSPAGRPSGLSLSPVNVRPSSDLATGERVYAIGAPEGLELTFSEGVISALRESEGARMIQTSAPISPGSSGGGLFDTHGNLVGITTFYLKEGQSLNFALPGEWVTDVLARSSTTAQSTLSDATLESAAWIDIGLEAVKKEDYDLALHSFSECVALKESDAYRAWFEIGKIWGKGKANYFVTSASSAYQAWFGSPTKSKVQEAKTKAVSALERTIQLRPDYAKAWRELGLTYMVEEKRQQAIDAEKEAARLDPRNRGNWFLLGAMYLKFNSYKEEIDALQQALRTPLKDSSVPAIPDATLLLMIGRAYSEEGDREGVLEIYTKLKAVDPESAEGFFQEFVLPKARGELQR